MAKQYFKFKKFIINQNNCAMKVGTDGVLIGAWADCENSTKILDIGTGTGLISLMMAQRSNAIIDSIEIDENSFLQAKKNILISDWQKRIHIYNVSFQNFVRLYSLILQGRGHVASCNLSGISGIPNLGISKIVTQARHYT
jgi:tRNA1Val (adenine37-N6)-methyltransferase